MLVGILQTNKSEDSHTSDALACLRALCNKTVVLCHNNSAIFNCDVNVHVTSREWNCTSNSTTLMWWAHTLGADWVMRLDDDMVLSPPLRKPATIKSLLQVAHAVGGGFVRTDLRELWGDTAHFRDDGIWGTRGWTLLQRNWFKFSPVFVPDPTYRLHKFCGHGKQVQAPPACVVYHTGCMTPERRLARVEKYRREDPDNKFQRDYSYMLDETGLSVKPVDGGAVTG